MMPSLSSSFVSLNHRQLMLADFAKRGCFYPYNSVKRPVTLFLFAFTTLLALLTSAHAVDESSDMRKPVKLILDTDMSGDADDAG